MLTDVYTKSLPTGVKSGMPILYYKADTSNNKHDSTLPMTFSDNCGNIYNYLDNSELVELGKPWVTGTSVTKTHKMEDADVFYDSIKSDKITTTEMPMRPDSYILISAGFDGEYGTSDDIYNYNKK